MGSHVFGIFVCVILSQDIRIHFYRHGYNRLIVSSAKTTTTKRKKTTEVTRDYCLFISIEFEFAYGSFEYSLYMFG